jgi:hypothetical protein
VQHPNPTVVLILLTNEVRSIAPGSYAAAFACGEAISLNPYGREADAEVYCGECSKKTRFAAGRLRDSKAAQSADVQERWISQAEGMLPHREHQPDPGQDECEGSRLGRGCGCGDECELATAEVWSGLTS